MGNSNGKESRNSGDRRSGESQNRSSPSSGFSFGLGPGSSDGQARLYSSRDGRPSRSNLGIFGSAGPSEREADPHGPRRETRQEREARKLEKERKNRAIERERSMKEEHVDGGYLVTLGTYVGVEDFSKPTVRKLQLERRLAPFWRGLNDHSSAWTEHQLVAASKGLPIPAPDEIPAQEDSPDPANASSGQDNTNSLPVPSASSSAISTPAGPTTPHTPVFGALTAPSPSPNASSTPSSLFLGRAKGMASLSASKNTSQPEIVRQEVQLPRDNHINGQPIGAYLYKDPGECPICFLYYPPFLNRTRCCDQPICSECFVQIKRPDPHPPEHTDPNSPPPANDAGNPAEEGLLQSEPACCPFCVMPELGITYDPPPYRRGLIYADQPVSNAPIPPGQNSQPKRRRGQSVSASAPEVITTDMVRPDWAKKLADARAHQARRAAAATALHTAAYTMNMPGSSSGFPGLGRRRRTNDGSGDNGPRQTLNSAQLEQLMAALEGQSAARAQGRDLVSARQSSRGGGGGGAGGATGPEDIEEMMMMEAIRQSLAAEEERKRKEEKEAAKSAKKEEKQRAKEQKKADKAAKKNGGAAGMASSSRNNSQFFSSSTNLSSEPPPPPTLTNAEGDKGKGRALSGEQPRMTSLGFNPLEEPTSVVGEGRRRSEQAATEDGDAGTAASTVRVVPETPPAASESSTSAPGLQGNFNFSSLAEMIDKENDQTVEEGPAETKHGESVTLNPRTESA